MGSERRHATVLFADLSGFTAAAERLDPEELADQLNECFAIMESAVRAHGGHVDNYIGDCIMATYGVPTALEHAPRQAVNSAIEMRNRLERLGTDRRLAFPIKIHVGINSGLVLAGDVGGEVRRDFTVTGDAVNVASRLTEEAPSGAIWIGRPTYAEVRSDFEFRHVGPVKVPGRDEPCDTWEVRSTEPRIFRAPVRRDRAVGSEMVGRQDELARLVGAVARLEAGEGGVIAVIGEAGIGKSRLLAELTAGRTTRDVTALEGRSLAIGAGLSFHPFVDLLRHWAGIADADADSLATPKLQRAVRTVVGDAFDEVFPFVATLMGLSLTGNDAARVQGLEGEALEELIFQKVRQLVQCMAQARPVLAIFEDLHWADRSSIRLLESLVRHVTRHPILLVLVGRADPPDTLDRVVRQARRQLPDRYLELSLGRLSDPQSEALIRNLLGGQDLPYPVRAGIIRRAEGNPFFIEEAVRSLIDEGAIVYRDHRFHITAKIASVEIAGSIQDVIMTRVDRLDDATRAVLQAAAVIGRFLQHRLLAEIVGPGPALDVALRVLTERQLVVVRVSGRAPAATPPDAKTDREYMFKHALLQEVVYEAILQRTRREMHHRVAKAIEKLFADRLADFYPMLAYHYTRADLPEKAEDYLFKAGEEAARAAASTEALAFFHEASRLYLLLHGGGGDPRRKALLEKNIALALLNTGNLTESIEHFDQSLEHFGVHPGRSRVRRYLTFLTDTAGVLEHFYVKQLRPRRVADWDAEREIFQVLLNRGRAEITSNPTRLFLDSVGVLHRLTRIDATQIDQASIVYACAGSVFGYSGISFDVTRRALDLAKTLIRPGNVRDRFICASMEFIHNYLRGDWDDSYVIDDALVAAALRFGQLWDVNTYLGLYCDRRLKQGDFRAAAEVLRQLRELDEAYGFSFARANHDITEALWLVEQRRLREALPTIEAYHAARHEEALKVLGLGTQAKVQVLLDDLDGAARSLAAAERITSRSRAIPPWHLSAYAAARVRHDVRAIEMAGELRNVPRALRRQAAHQARHALRIAARVATQRTEIHQLAGRLWWLLGHRRRALATWRSGVLVGTSLRARPELARTYAEIGRSLLEAGESSLTFDGLGAEACLDRAAAIFAEIGTDWDRSRAQEAGYAAA